MARETLRSARQRAALAGRTAIVTGGSGAFGAATLKVLRYLGADAMHVARHAPGALDRAVSARVRRLVRDGAFRDAALATDLRARHKEAQSA